MGCQVGSNVGAGVGALVGDIVGVAVGTDVGESVGVLVGVLVGADVGQIYSLSGTHRIPVSSNTLPAEQVMVWATSPSIHHPNDLQSALM